VLSAKCYAYASRGALNSQYLTTLDSTPASSIDFRSHYPSLTTMNPEIERVNAFWFNRSPLEWMRAPEGFDAECKTQFQDLVQKALAGDLDDWASTPEGSLALVVLLNQLPRNVFRGEAISLSGDAKAGDVATRAVASDFDKSVSVIQASALYIAILHQENLISQVAARSLVESLRPRCVTAEEHDWVDKGAAAAKGHIELISRFGRYPSRNALLGRKNTEAEDAFLKEHPSGFP